MQHQEVYMLRTVSLLSAFRPLVSLMFIGMSCCAWVHSQVPTASCTFTTFLLNPSNPNNPRITAGDVNDNRTVVGNADSLGFVHFSNGTTTYFQPSNAQRSS